MDQARDAQSVHPSTSTLEVNNRLRLPFAAWVGHWSRVDLPLLQPPREGVVISLDFLQKKKSRISYYYSLHVLDSGHYMCHAISTTGATLNAASPWYRPSYAPRLPPFPSLHPLSSSLCTHLPLVTGVPPRQSRLLPPASPRGNCHRV